MAFLSGVHLSFQFTTCNLRANTEGIPSKIHCYARADGRDSAGILADDLGAGQQSHCDGDRVEGEGSRQVCEVLAESTVQ
jgi:hypothetical protein